MWWFVGLWYVFFFGLAGLYWGDLQPSQAPFVPWLIGGMMGSAIIAIWRQCLAYTKQRRGNHATRH